MLGQLQEEMISVAACYTELKLSLQKSSLSKRAKSAKSYNGMILEYAVLATK